jgi:hypothetical protein
MGWYVGTSVILMIFLSISFPHKDVLIYTCRYYNLVYPLYHFGLSKSIRMMKPPAHVQINSESI